MGAEPTTSEYRIVASLHSFWVKLEAEMSSDSLQEAAPGSVYQVLLVGKVPDEVPAGLQVLSQVG